MVRKGGGGTEILEIEQIMCTPRAYVYIFMPLLMLLPCYAVTERALYVEIYKEKSKYAVF